MRAELRSEKAIILFIWIIILGLLQSAASLNINFLALFAVFVGLRKGPLWGLFIGIFIGILAEILSSSALGLNLTLYSGIGLLSGIIGQKIYYKEGPVMEFLFSFFGILFFYLAYFVFTRTIQTGVLFTIILSSLVSPLLFRLIE
jgi:cell shape-determining protein MreD